ncbi:hypothetical protein ARMGADRAFT_362990 [Armillaria gallica]|uniref:Uncharacterized protein n=1 Tax=Armillaria gallica TaxID=47427 RepID=A0A2H3DCM1_ARMGA|nr:hypothetical protein ARMGADRAFT_362990 [Armillaria gallica]
MWNTQSQLYPFQKSIESFEIYQVGVQIAKYIDSQIITAGADTFSDRKNETSKCCDISFDLLMIKTSRGKQAER